MVKNKIQILCGVLAFAVSACSDSGYNPTVGAGYNSGLYNNGAYNNGLYNNGAFNNGLYNNGFAQNGAPCNWAQSSMQPCNPNSSLSYSTYYNPYLMYYNQYSQPGAQAALAWRAQLMFNPGFRMNSGMYYPSSPYSNVYVNQYPTYTPDQCACYTAPCDCDGVLNRVYHSGSSRYDRRINRINRRIERRNARIERRMNRLQSRLGSTYHSGSACTSSGSDCGTVVVHHDHVVTTTTTSNDSDTPSPEPVDSGTPDSGTPDNGTPDNSLNAKAKIVRLSLKSDDAEQLYIRLARKEERQLCDGKEKAFPIRRTGTNYYCVKSDEKDHPFFCQIELDVTAGKVLQQYSDKSGAGTAELQVGNVATEYSGPAVSISRETPELATLILRDGISQKDFDKLNGSASDTNPDANIVDLDQIQIRKVQNGTKYLYEIEIRAKTETGEAINRSEWQ